MKRTILSIVSIMALSGISYAGDSTEIVDVDVIEIPTVDESAFYVGLGGSYMGMYNDLTNEEFTTTGVTLQVGYQYNRYLAVEARYTMGVANVAYENGNTVNLDNDNFDTDFSNIGIYLKPIYPIGDFKIYGLLGYGDTILSKVPVGSTVASRGEDGFQWGLGLDYAITDNISVFADYARVYDDKGFNFRALTADINVQLITAGLTYRF